MNKRFFALLLVVLTLVLCACNTAPATPDPTGNTQAPTGSASGVQDSVFDSTENDDKSFSVSVPVNQQNPTETTVPKEETTDPSEDSKEDTGNAGADATEPKPMTYEEFIAMSPEKQQAYQMSFSDVSKFFEWYNAAKEKYDKEHPPIEVGDGPITLPIN